MLIFRGKLNWYDYAVNEGVIVVIPIAMRVGDPIHMYWQWTKDAKGNKKINVQVNDIIDTVLTPGQFNYCSDAYYKFQATLQQSNTQLSIKMSNPARDTKAFILNRVFYLHPSVEDPLHPSPDARIYVGKMNWYDYAVDEIFVIICPSYIDTDSQVCAYWQWTKNAHGSTKVNVDCQVNYNEFAAGDNGFKFKFIQNNYYTFWCDLDEAANQLKATMSNPAGDSPHPFVMTLQIGKAGGRKRSILSEDVST